MHAAAALLAVAALTGCDTQAGSAPAPLPAFSAPTDWVTTSSGGGDLELTLPPWLVVFDRSGGMFANEPPGAPGVEIPVQLFAQGPDLDALAEYTIDPVRWIERRVSGPAQGASNPGEGVPVVRQVQLPAGVATRYERVDRAGTTLEWRFIVFAIRTPRGVAYLQIDGTPAGWAARSTSFDAIAQLLRTR